MDTWTTGKFGLGVQNEAGQRLIELCQENTLVIASTRNHTTQEKTLESPLDCKEIQPVHPKGDQSWVFIGRTDVEAETPIFWPPDVKS